MAENRLDRKQETREKGERRKPWAPPSMLPDPEPQAGYVFRYIRTSMLGSADPTNISSKFREGWEPVRAEDHPELMAFSDSTEERFKDNIVIGGLILCKMPEETAKERDAFYRNQTRNQIHSVDNNLMRENDPRMPLFHDRKSKVTFGSGN
ncbi:MAG TPA: hypothetical protein VKP88_04240 [Candidatus Paceibacterota bacterium]|nr:hypothetical protein [Candidatus Paceibacterota bacterium]